MKFVIGYMLFGILCFFGGYILGDIKKPTFKIYGYRNEGTKVEPTWNDDLSEKETELKKKGWECVLLEEDWNGMDLRRHWSNKKKVRSFIRIGRYFEEYKDRRWDK